MTSNKEIFGLVATLVVASLGALINKGAIPGIKGEMGWFGPVFRSKDGRYVSQNEATALAGLHVASVAAKSAVSGVRALRGNTPTQRSAIG